MESSETPSETEIEALRREVLNHPTELWRRLDLGVALYNRAHYLEAIHELQKAQLWPQTRWKAMKFLAKAYGAKGMPDLAVSVRQQLSKESGEGGDEGSSPVPIPKL